MYEYNTLYEAGTLNAWFLNVCFPRNVCYAFPVAADFTVDTVDIAALGVKHVFRAEPIGAFSLPAHGNCEG